MDKKNKVLFTGGGTGGHIMPIIAIGRELKKLDAEIELHYIGSKSDCIFLSRNGFKTHAIAAGKMRRYFSFQNFIDLPFKIPFGFLQGFFLLLFIRPDLVFSKGGTGSLPITYCARILRVPVFIHESDMVPGLSNKISSKWAKKVFVSFEKTEYFRRGKMIVVGNPIRKDLLGGNMEDARKSLNLASQRPAVLVLGGSQGAESINELVLLALNDLLESYEVVHVAGPNNYRKNMIELKIILLNRSLEKYYHLYEFLNQVQLKNAYLASSIIVSRAGSGSIFEIAAFGKPSILIPLPSSANNHQSKNAYEYYEAGSCIVVEQESLSSSFLISEIRNVISQSKKMGGAALKFAKPDAAEDIAREILNFQF